MRKIWVASMFSCQLCFAFCHSMAIKQNNGINCCFTSSSSRWKWILIYSTETGCFYAVYVHLFPFPEQWCYKLSFNYLWTCTHEFFFSIVLSIFEFYFFHFPLEMANVHIEQNEVSFYRWYRDINSTIGRCSFPSGTR